MFKVELHDLDWSIQEELTRVIIVANYKGKWLFCKKKGKNTWEIPGGHIEPNETWQHAAQRELYEETGATANEVKPICLYSISTYGLLCYADIEKIDEMPNYEMEKVDLFDSLPKELSYPESHTLFFNKVIDEINKSH